MNAAIVGYIAAAFSVSAFVPQVWKVIKTRDTEAMSTAMWVLDTSGFAMWVIYGIALGSWPIMLPNAICGVCAAFILVMNLVSHPTKHKIADILDPTVHREP